MTHLSSSAEGDRSISVSGDVIDSVLWTGDIILNGVRHLPTDYGARLSNFLTEYLGTDRKPVPFGGRGKILNQLDNWLSDKTASPYLLLAAPAGRGKSALLTRWVKSLEKYDNLAIVFWPISIRFRTNLSSVTFAALAARLAHLHGEKVPADMQTAIEVWRGMMSNYLQRPLPNGKQLLVVLDGLDEAADWEAAPDLFPLAPHPGLRVVVSARFMAGDTDSSSWLTRLGWDRPGLAISPLLDPLDKSGVRDVLIKMGCPLDELGQRMDIISEVHRLSEGDPLLIRLYVEDLWSKGPNAQRLKPEELSQSAPGLNGYFKKWWNDQRILWGDKTPLREISVQTILNLLAAALGPLSRVDLLSLCGKDSGINSLTIEDALTPLARFIVGDGDKQGYVFSHPRLAQFFREQLILKEWLEWDQRFLAWGANYIKSLTEGTLEPKAVPSYVLQYYGAHLERANAPVDALMGLVTRNWAEAWFAKEGSYANFLRDVNRARHACSRENIKVSNFNSETSWLGNEIRCALIESSLHSLVSNMPDELPAILVKTNNWSPIQALLNVRQIPDNHKALKAFAYLAPFIPNDKIEDVFNIVAGVDDPYYLCELISQLEERIPDSLLPTAIKISDRIDVPHLRAMALSKLARRVPDLLPDIIAFAKNVEDAAYRASALRIIAQNFVDYIPDALLSIKEVSNEYVRADILSSLVDYFPSSYLSILIKLIEGFQNQNYQTFLLLRFAKRFPEFEPIAIKALSKIDGKMACSSLIMRTDSSSPQILALLTKLGDSIKDPLFRANILMFLSRHIEDKLSDALIAAKEINDPLDRAKLISKLAIQSANILPVALDELRNVHSLDDRIAILCDLAIYHRQVLPFVVEQINQMTEESKYAKNYCALAREFPEFITQALKVSQRIGDLSVCVNALCLLSVMVPRLLSCTLPLIPKVESATSRAIFLCLLVPKFPNLFSPTLNAVKEISDDIKRTELLTGLIKQFPEILPQALNSAQKIKVLRRKEELLHSIIETMPALSSNFLKLINGMEDAYSRASSLIYIGIRFPDTISESETSEAKQLIDEYLDKHRRRSFGDDFEIQESSPLGYLHQIDELADVYSTTEEKNIAMLPYHGEGFLDDEYYILPELPEGLRYLYYFAKGRSTVFPKDFLAILTEKSSSLRSEKLGILINDNPKFPKRMLAAVEKVEDPVEKCKLKIGLTELFPEYLALTLDSITGIANMSDQAELLCILATGIPDAIPSVTAITLGIQDSSLRSEIVQKLIAKISPDQLPLQLMSYAISSKVKDASPTTQADFFNKLGLNPNLELLSYENLYVILARLSQQNRVDIINNLISLRAWIKKLGGDKALVEMGYAISDIVSWWP